jgi:hypothetical protein
MSRAHKGGSNFFGDVGTTFNGPAREQIEEDRSSGAGHPGNDVDIAQRYAQSEADEHTEDAERLVRDMERRGIRLGDARAKFVSDMAEQYRGGPAQPTQPQEPQEEPSLSRAADDKFWSDKEAQQEAVKRVRPPKL